jgi:hypothetical protein
VKIRNKVLPPFILFDANIDVSKYILVVLHSLASSNMHESEGVRKLEHNIFPNRI